MKRFLVLLVTCLGSLALANCATVHNQSLSGLEDSPTRVDPADIVTNEASIGRAALEELAVEMLVEVTEPAALQRLVQTFLELNSSDSEYLLSRMRENVMPSEAIAAHFDRAYAELNAQSMRAHGVPAHLAGARGLELDGDAVFRRFDLTPELVIPHEDAEYEEKSAMRSHRCPSINVRSRHRYSWRSFRFGPRIEFRNARRISGCGMYHTRFNRNISRWGSIGGSGVCVVALNGHGGMRNAGDRRGFYYKWWTVPSCGLNPITVTWAIRAR